MLFIFQLPMIIWLNRFSRQFQVANVIVLTQFLCFLFSLRLFAISMSFIFLILFQSFMPWILLFESLSMSFYLISVLIFCLVFLMFLFICIQVSSNASWIKCIFDHIISFFSNDCKNKIIKTLRWDQWHHWQTKFVLQMGQTCEQDTT